MLAVCLNAKYRNPHLVRDLVGLSIFWLVVLTSMFARHFFHGSDKA